jgi:hypothetical protein
LFIQYYSKDRLRLRAMLRWKGNRLSLVLLECPSSRALVDFFSLLLISHPPHCLGSTTKRPPCCDTRCKRHMCSNHIHSCPLLSFFLPLTPLVSRSRTMLTDTKPPSCGSRTPSFYLVLVFPLYTNTSSIQSPSPAPLRLPDYTKTRYTGCRRRIFSTLISFKLDIRSK